MLALIGTATWAEPPKNAKTVAGAKKEATKRKELSADANSAAAALKDPAAKTAGCTDCAKNYDACKASCPSEESLAAGPSDCEADATDIYQACIHDHPANCHKTLETSLENCARCGDIVCQ